MRFACLCSTLLIVSAVVMATAASPRPASQDDPWPALVGRLETAALAGKTDAVKTERLNVLRLLAGSPAADRVPILRYTVAYAGWRLAFAPGLAAAEQIALLEDAEVQLSAVLSASPNDVEALGLLASVYGARIAKSPDLGMTLGIRSSQTLDRATHLAPGNPRVLVMSGQSLFNTPPEYGGSVPAAEARFRDALAAFDKEPAGRPWPNWGRFDAHAWLGQALAKRGDKPGARAEYEKALTIAPDSGWVRFSLLPEVK